MVSSRHSILRTAIFLSLLTGMKIGIEICEPEEKCFFPFLVYQSSLLHFSVFKG